MTVMKLDNRKSILLKLCDWMQMSALTTVFCSLVLFPLFFFICNIYFLFIGGRVQKRGVYTKLVQKLSDPHSCLTYNIEQFEQILNLVLVDHSLTGCLLALSHKRKNKVSVTIP